jgi:hypothetical protein
MHKLKEKLMDELYDYEEKIKKNPNARMNDMELEKVHKISDTVKNLCKIEMLEDGEGYSEDGGHWMARGNYGGGHGTHGMHSYNDGGYNEGGSSYACGRRYAKRDSMGRYSRDDGKNDIIESLEDMMDDASTEKERRALRECISTMKNA